MNEHTCKYFDLMRDMRYFAGQGWELDIDQCPNEGSEYVEVPLPSDQGVQLTHLCAEHSGQVPGAVMAQ